MKKPKALAFDLGNVLVRIHPERFFPSLGVHDVERQLKLRDRVVQAVQFYEKGSLTTYDWLEQLGEILDYEFQKDAIRRAFATILGDPIPEMDRIVERAAQNYTLALVSNTNPIHIALAEANVPSLSALQLRFLSYEMRALKPEPEYYVKLLRGLALAPDEILFIDDRQENVDAAQRHGMLGIVFHSPAQLRDDLLVLAGITL
jgi:HAD superfamily hydrolase (TIGR01509 family)